MAYIQTSRAGGTATAYYEVSQNEHSYTVKATSVVISGAYEPTLDVGIFLSSSISNYVFSVITGSNGASIERSFSRNGTFTVNTSVVIPKTKTAQTVYFIINYNGLDYYQYVALNIPAKTSYTISFDANTGANAPASQAKWYNEALTLPNALPTKEGYKCIGWATSASIAATGQPTYLAGGTYPAGNNAAATLYAVWELAYTKPVISNLSVERCLANGTDDDEGKYAKVTFDWNVYRSANARYYGGTTYPYTNNGCVAEVTVGTHTETATSSDGSGTFTVVVGNGDYNNDTQYNVEVTISDTETVQSDKTTVATGLLTTTFFPLDFNADASAMGIFRPAPDNDEGVYLGKKIAVKGTVTAEDELIGANALLELNTTATSGTDKEIYDALVALGWTDCIV